MKDKQKLYYVLGALGTLLVIVVAAIALKGSGSNLTGNISGNNVAAPKAITGSAPFVSSPGTSKPSPYSANPDLKYNNDQVPPDLTLKYPAGGETIEGSSIKVTTYINDNDKVYKVEFRSAGNLLGTVYEPNPNSNHYQFSFDTTKYSNNSKVSLDIWAYDRAGNIAKKNVSFVVVPTVDKTPPTVTIDSPYDGQTIHGNNFTIYAHANDKDSKVTKVEFRSGLFFEVLGTLTKPDVQTNAYKYFIDTTKIPEGSQILSVWAYDEAGNVGKKTISFNVDNKPAGLTVTSPKVGEVVFPRDIVGDNYAMHSLMLKMSVDTTEELSSIFFYNAEGKMEGLIENPQSHYDFEYIVLPVTWKVTEYDNLWDGKYKKVDYSWPKKLAEGEHTIMIVAKDKSYNVSNKTITFNLEYNAKTGTPKLIIKSIK